MSCDVHGVVHVCRDSTQKYVRKRQYFKNFDKLSIDISDRTVIHGSHFWDQNTTFGFS